ncbi:MAG: GUN4 domain-containing protein [Coleofasciculaceae cyanobacterium SM2_1_6]|nr:GUN4 domain-containing protein [Coleofasciculaceae cyanobacterium SM2_1_6]
MLKAPELETQDIDYTKLIDFLVAGDWQRADQETMSLILRITGRTEAGYPKSSDIKKIPADVIQTIDNLWITHSDGKFGFTPQKQVWLKAEQNYTEFCEILGWHRDSSWVDYSEVDFTLNAVVGHLPALLFPYPLGDTKVTSFALGSWRASLLGR